jgi:butyryl-CoA dehydrogenase
MEFTLNEEQQMIRDSARKFAQENIAPYAEEGQETGKWPYHIWNKMAELGYTAVIVPEEYGGGGMSYFDSILIMEEFARADDAFATSYQVHNIICDMFMKFGTGEQKKKYLPILASGEKMGAFALTEPNAGSDAGGVQTRAVLQNGQWVINGNKIFITNAGLDNSLGVVLMCVTGGKEGGRKEISSILVEKGTPGFIVGNKFRKVGWNIMDTRELMFEDCRVPEENLVGDLGKGISQALFGLNLGRIDFGAIGTGVCQAALDYSLEYAKQRVQFGQPIARFQAIAFMLADMQVNTELARLMTWKAVNLKDAGLPHDTEATMAKLVASENAVRNVDMGFQIHGGYGFMKEYAISRLYQNAKILTIGEGTSEVCRIVISRAMGCR